MINPKDVNSFEKMASYIYESPPDSVLYTKGKAVIDTGATHTVIPENIAHSLKLEKIGESDHKMANGKETKGGRYSIMICFPQKFISITHVSAINGTCEILIGMDILWRSHFSYQSRFSENQSINIVGGKLTIKFQN